MNNERFIQRRIEANDTLLHALKKMDLIDKKLLLVFNGDKFIGLVSIGDIQRAIIANLNLDVPVSKILRKNIRVASITDTEDSIREQMIRFRAECMPVLDLDGNLTNVIFWEDLFNEDIKNTGRDLGLPVVIMAGGEGRRLRPLTNIIPKPLIPVKGKTILEQIMDRFIRIGCGKFFLSVNYKAEILRYYIDNLETKYDVTYFRETEPLGTAGSLHLLKGRINTPFFVSNCDILINQDLGEIYDYHRDQNNEMTLVSALKHIKIPYGTLEAGENGRLVQLIEKPEMTFKINSGIYLLQPHLLEEIPENTFYDITELIQKIISRNGKVGVFPVSQGSWTDIGDWKEFLKISEISRDEGTADR